MDNKEYQNFVKKMALPMSEEKEIMTYGLGIAGEAGDVAGCIKKVCSHKDDQIAGIKENLGDTLWYIAAVCNFYGWKLDEVIDENVEKLEKRYPNGVNFREAARGGKRVDWNENKSK